MKHPLGKNTMGIGIRWCGLLVYKVTPDVAGVSKPREELRRTNEQLCWECAMTREEHRLLKETVDNLKREYETSKDVDAFRRYMLLKGMIKRSVTHVRLRTDERAGQTLTTAKQRQEMKHHEQQVTGTE